MKAHVHIFEATDRKCIRIGPYAEDDEDAFVMCDFVGEAQGITGENLIKIAKILAAGCEIVDDKPESRIILPNEPIIHTGNRQQRRNGHKFRVIRKPMERKNGEGQEEKG